MPNYTLYYFNSRGRAEICRMLFAAAGVHYNDRRIDYTEWNDFRSKMSGSVLPILEIDGRTQIPQSMAIARYLSREFGFHGRNNLEMARIDFISDCFYEIIDDYLRLFHDKEGRIMYDQMSDMRTRYIDMDGKMTYIPVVSSTSQSRVESVTSSGMPPGAYSDTYCSDVGLDTKSSLYSEGRIGDSYSRGMHSDCYRTDISPESYPGPGRRHRENTYIDGRMSEKRMRYMETCRRVLPFMEKTLEMQNGGHMFFCGEEMMMCDMMCYCALENPMMENSSFFSTYPRLMALRERVANEPQISKYIKRRYQSDF